MVQAAIQCILSYEEVSTMIPVAKTSKQLQHNLSAPEGKLSMNVFEEIRILWEEEIKNAKLPW